MQMIALLLPSSTTAYLDDIRFVQIASLHCKTTLMKDTKVLLRLIIIISISFIGKYGGFVI